jgi:hypothetical protein
VFLILVSLILVFQLVLQFVCYVSDVMVLGGLGLFSILFYGFVFHLLIEPTSF